jgi:hypothetical protein
MKFLHFDHIRSNKIVRDGKSNWPYLLCLWDLQVLFFNLFTCVHNCGSQSTGALAVSPPSVAEYLYSANHGLLVPLHNAEEADNFGAEEIDNNQYNYYHL